MSKHFSYSKVSCWNDCPYKYKLNYIDKLETIPDMSPNNALYEGTACHEGIEKRSIDEALNSYRLHFPEITPVHEVEMLKLKTILPKAIEQIPHGEYEYKLESEDGFIGYIDLLVKIDENTYDIYDFKYSNNASRYKSSAQVMVYKYYFEKLNPGKTIRNMYYIMIPKYQDILDESVNREEFEQKVVEWLNNQELRYEPIEYNPQMVGQFFARKVLMQKETGFAKRPSWMCNWCNFKNYCKSNGKDTSELVIKPEEVNLYEDDTILQVQ